MIRVWVKVRAMNTLWSRTARALSPYVSGEQPRTAPYMRITVGSADDIQRLVAAVSDILWG